MPQAVAALRGRIRAHGTHEPPPPTAPPPSEYVPRRRGSLDLPGAPPPSPSASAAARFMLSAPHSARRCSQPGLANLAWVDRVSSPGSLDLGAPTRRSVDLRFSSSGAAERRGGGGGNGFDGCSGGTGSGNLNGTGNGNGGGGPAGVLSADSGSGGLFPRRRSMEAGGHQRQPAVAAEAPGEYSRPLRGASEATAALMMAGAGPPQSFSHSHSHSHSQQQFQPQSLSPGTPSRHLAHNHHRPQRDPRAMGGKLLHAASAPGSPTSPMEGAAPPQRQGVGGGGGGGGGSAQQQKHGGASMGVGGGFSAGSLLHPHLYPPPSEEGTWRDGQGNGRGGQDENGYSTDSSGRDDGWHNVLGVASPFLTADNSTDSLFSFSAANTTPRAGDARSSSSGALAAGGGGGITGGVSAVAVVAAAAAPAAAAGADDDDPLSAPPVESSRNSYPAASGGGADALRGAGKALAPAAAAAVATTGASTADDRASEQSGEELRRRAADEAARR